MIAFDLEKAKRGVPLMTKRGTTATFITILQGGQPAPLVIGLQFTKPSPGFESMRMENYYLNGKFGLGEHDMDLFMDEI